MPSTPSEQSPLRIGVDVGGTFTDLVSFDPQTGQVGVIKLPSTPPDFHLAVIEAVNRARGNRPAQIVHGSTVATNALLQRAGEPCAFVTTEGFADMLLIGRQNRPKLYALNIVRPLPLTAPENWFTVAERIAADGSVVQSLDELEVDRLIHRIRAKNLRHVAVCLLFSFVNDSHEQLIGRRCEQAGLMVSLSSQILPEFREYERASTTVINASLRPTVQGYLNALRKGLGEDESYDRMDEAPAREGEAPAREGEAPAEPSRLRLRSVLSTETGEAASGSGSAGASPSQAQSPPPLDLRIMHSGGGTLSVDDAQRSAAKLVLSGPAGGVLGAKFVAEAAGILNVITYDMGGTSTDVATIIDGRPQWTTASTIDGLPIGLPSLDIQTVGAGGGSVAYLDAGGALRVGPRSAGALPGPACYGRGGTEPTVTDANLLLGRIVPGQFAGGTMRVDPELARRAVEPLAKAMGKSIVETALGICKVAENNMGRAVGAVTSRRGLDPRQFTLLSFGGAGGLHACAIADGLEIKQVLVPPYAGVLSALGMVIAPPVADASRTVLQLRDQLDDPRLAAEFGALSGLTSDVIPLSESASVEAYADVRFTGQSHELTVKVDRPSRQQIESSFLDEYRARYGQTPAGRAVEIVTLRLRRLGKVAPLQLPALQEADAPSIDRGDLVLQEGSTVAVPRLTRETLTRSNVKEGPFLIIDSEATTFVPPGWSAAATPSAAILLSRKT